MADETRLEIKGYQDRLVPNQLYQQAGIEKRKLAILLPGFGYTNDMPLLYYLRLAAIESGLDVLRVDYAYFRDPDWLNLPDEAQMGWLYSDTDAALQAALAYRDYTKTVVIGKSLGTMAMAHMLEQHDRMPPSRWVWLTPVLNDPVLRRNFAQYHPRSLLVMGSADRYYDLSVLKELGKNSQLDTDIFQGANHSLEIPGNTSQSIYVLGKVVDVVQAFIKEEG